MKSCVALTILAVLVYFVGTCGRIRAAEAVSKVVFIVGRSDEDAFALKWTPTLLLKSAVSAAIAQRENEGAVLSQTGKKIFSVDRFGKRDGVGSMRLSPGDIVVFGPLDEAREQRLRQSFVVLEKVND